MHGSGSVNPLRLNPQFRLRRVLPTFEEICFQTNLDRPVDFDAGYTLAWNVAATSPIKASIKVSTRVKREQEVTYV
jgi:hypothetical protein